MPTAKEPPDYGFAFVMEYTTPLDPTLYARLVAYEEPARETRLVVLLGKPRHLVFLTKKTSRDRANRLGYWRDVTEAFIREWERPRGEGWRHVTAPPPLVEPDPVPVSVAADPLAMTVPVFQERCHGGAYDDVLDELERRERAQAKPRNGVIGAIAARRALRALATAG